MAEIVSDISSQAKVFEALSEPTRLKIVELLAKKGELSGTEVAETLDISLALFCHHSKTLVDAGLLDKKKIGQTSYIKLKKSNLLESLQTLLQKVRD